MAPFGRRRRTGPASRGAVALETVIVLPLLLLIGFATIELGMAWQRSREVNNATRSAARVASNLADDRFADYEALLTLRAGLRDVDSVEAVIIYSSASAEGAVPPTCVTSGTSVNGLCNYYTGLQLKNLALSDFPSPVSCSGGLDVAWCPLDRERDPLANPDYVGIWVRIKQDAVTGIFPGADHQLTIEDAAVMRLEPEVSL